MQHKLLHYSTVFIFVTLHYSIYYLVLPYTTITTLLHYTGVSRDVYEAATLLQTRLEELLPQFTLLAVDKAEMVGREREAQGKRISSSVCVE